MGSRTREATARTAADSPNAFVKLPVPITPCAIGVAWNSARASSADRRSFQSRAIIANRQIPAAHSAASTGEPHQRHMVVNQPRERRRGEIQRDAIRELIPVGCERGEMVPSIEHPLQAVGLEEGIHDRHGGMEQNQGLQIERHHRDRGRGAPGDGHRVAPAQVH